MEEFAEKLSRVTDKKGGQELLFEKIAQFSRTMDEAERPAWKERERKVEEAWAVWKEVHDAAWAEFMEQVKPYREAYNRWYVGHWGKL